jgi:hypothetical protein
MINPGLMHHLKDKKDKRKISDGLMITGVLEEWGKFADYSSTDDAGLTLYNIVEIQHRHRVKSHIRAFVYIVSVLSIIVFIMAAVMIVILL